MKNNNHSKKPRGKTGYRLSAAALALIPVALSAQVNGDWHITALNRTDVKPIKAPGLVPEHTVGTFTDSYSFTSSGFSTTGINNARWVQKQSQYTVTLDGNDVLNLERQFRESLQQKAPNIVIRQLKLVARKLTGYQLTNGLWGNERYEYKIDSCLDFCEVVKVVQTIQIVGLEPSPGGAVKAAGFSVPSADSKPSRSGAVATAVDTVLKHMKKQGAAAH